MYLEKIKNLSIEEIKIFFNELRIQEKIDFSCSFFLFFINNDDIKLNSFESNKNYNILLIIKESEIFIFSLKKLISLPEIFSINNKKFLNYLKDYSITLLSFISLLELPKINILGNIIHHFNITDIPTNLSEENKKHILSIMKDKKIQLNSIEQKEYFLKHVGFYDYIVYHLFNNGFNEKEFNFFLNNINNCSEHTIRIICYNFFVSSKKIGNTTSRLFILPNDYTKDIFFIFAKNNIELYKQVKHDIYLYIKILKNQKEKYLIFFDEIDRMIELENF